RVRFRSGSPDQINPNRHEWVEVIVESIPKRRGKEHGSLRTGLMMIVNDLGKPLEIQDAVNGFGFGLVRHVEVAVVIVAYVLLVQTGQTRRGAPGGLRFSPVPVCD